MEAKCKEVDIQLTTVGKQSYQNPIVNLKNCCIITGVHDKRAGILSHEGILQK